MSPRCRPREYNRIRFWFFWLPLCVVILFFGSASYGVRASTAPDPFRRYGNFPVASPRLFRTRMRGFLFESQESDQSLLGGEAVLAHQFRLYGAAPSDHSIHLEGAVFSQFQESTDDYELINADYAVTIPWEYDGKFFGTRLELFHQSSHLGDEFAARTGRNRISFSHESIRGFLFKSWSRRGRAFVGGEYALRMEPDVNRGAVQAGFAQFYGDFFIASSVKSRNRNDWTPSISVQVGSHWWNDKFSVALEYYDGPLPTGQFFREERTAWSLLITFLNE